MTLQRFWKWLETRNGLVAVDFEWRDACGDCFDVVKKMLLPTGNLALCFPNPNPYGLPFRVINHCNGSIVAVCRENSGFRIPLKESDVVLWRLDLKKFGKIIAKELAITESSSDNDKNCFLIGHKSVTSGLDIPVYLIFMSDPDRIELCINRIRSENGLIALMPTSQTIGSALKERFASEKIKFVPLSDILFFQDGSFHRSSTWNTYVSSFCQLYHPGVLVPKEPDYLFRKEGMWNIRYKGKSIYLESSLKGPIFVKYLLQNQGDEIHVVKMLYDISGDERVRSAGNGDDALTSEAIEQCREKYEQLMEKIQIAKQTGNDAATERIELGKLAAFLSESIGLGGKSRKDINDVDTIKRRITKNINDMLIRVDTEFPELALHLHNALTLSISMRYRPDGYVDWIF